jgi:hypothetical protein
MMYPLALGSFLVASALQAEAVTPALDIVRRYVVNKREARDIHSRKHHESCHDDDPFLHKYIIN